MPYTKLAAALTAVNWNDNVKTFLADEPVTAEIAKKNLRVAIWAKQLEAIDKGNPALCFVREMQIAGQHVAALIALALYKPAAASMRAMLESGLYYTYFRTHPSELATLVRSSDYYISKRFVLTYHKEHSPNFGEMQNSLALISRLEQWYSEVSAVVHGQIPGAWVEHKSLAEVSLIKPTRDIVVKAFIEGEEILHRLFLCTVGKTLWSMFSHTSKQELLRGLPGDIRTTLGLDKA
jgi:hypothetical protein